MSHSCGERGLSIFQDVQPLDRHRPPGREYSLLTSLLQQLERHLALGFREAVRVCNLRETGFSSSQCQLIFPVIHVSNHIRIPKEHLLNLDKHLTKPAARAIAWQSKGIWYKNWNFHLGVLSLHLKQLYCAVSSFPSQDLASGSAEW